MTNLEIKKLLIQIKVFYSRFDAVEKTDGGYAVSTQVIDAWHRQIGWMDYDRALKILDDYMQSENGSKTPTAALWVRNGKVKQASVWCTAYFDQLRGVIKWKPEQNGEVFERKVKSIKAGAIEDEDGYLWAVPGGEG